MKENTFIMLMLSVCFCFLTVWMKILQGFVVQNWNDNFSDTFNFSSKCLKNTNEIDVKWMAIEIVSIVWKVILFSFLKKIE